MHIPNIPLILLFVLLPFCFATTSPEASSNNALALIESQSDLTLIASLIRRDPELVKLYSSVKDATVIVATDSSFPTTNTSAIVYSNRACIRAILQATVIEGQYPTGAITTDPVYANTKLSNPRFVDTSRGRAVAKLVEINGKKTVDIGVGNRANITLGNLRFKNGILHKLSNALNAPETFFTTAAALNNSAISQLPASFVTTFGIITGSPDTTLFSVTNEALETVMAANPNPSFEELLESLSYFVVSPGVYFENTFTGRSVRALNGASLRLSGFGTGKTMVNDAVIVRSDIFTTNGVLHILDRPVVPLGK